ncbi:hypothetical protein BN946_scf184585.g1 [Trametes cinnabarina]|uniref:Transcription factor domain-containing protein n=1 Tax=Pycnoporus cinnabarinus TaxID=5643 RepID=A0A060ST97_PYCCI|nr:hypothetical protein BN946_scf184585.g1 [Trametes cinnabarina]
MALFESSAHPLYSPERANNALQLLDRIIHVLSLTSIDHDNPNVSSFQPRLAPVVDMPNGYQRPLRCSCIGYPSSPSSPLVQDHLAQSYSFNPPWDLQWPETEIRKEECRRLCWCALTLVSNHTAYCSAFHTEPMELTLADPSNFSLLFPGEAYERMPAHHQASGQSPKESIWALYCRSMLLWNSCVRRDEALSTDERANFAIDVFQETREVQDALNMHVCNLDTGLITRMAITYELRRRLQDGSDVVPVTVDRRQAEEWLFYQEQVATRVKESVLQLGEAEGHVLACRPFLATWFSSQVAICLSLWDYNRSLHRALELAKAFLVPLDVLNALWPCPAQASNRDELRRKLEIACTSAHLHPPPPIEANLPPIFHR